MVDTPIFSIFHRVPAPPAPSVGEPAAPAPILVAPLPADELIVREVAPPSLVPNEQGMLANAPHVWEQLPAYEPGEPTDSWRDPYEITGIPLEADQLGLANPIIITLLARLENSATIELDASQSGIYRPQRFRVAPWSGFPYDEAETGRTGFAAGTRILTARGEMEVERLLPGDTALALRTPKLMPIAWIGRSSATVAPVLIEAGALGPDLPRRALCLAPEQAVFVEPVPVPASQLVNGTTIRMLDTAEIDLFHVDLGAAEILFAEGLPLSSSNRARVGSAQ